MQRRFGGALVVISTPPLVPKLEQTKTHIPNLSSQLNHDAFHDLSNRAGQPHIPRYMASEKEDEK